MQRVRVEMLHDRQLRRVGTHLVASVPQMPLLMREDSSQLDERLIVAFGGITIDVAEGRYVDDCRRAPIVIERTQAAAIGLASGGLDVTISMLGRSSPRHPRSM